MTGRCAATSGDGKCALAGLTSAVRSRRRRLLRHGHSFGCDASPINGIRRAQLVVSGPGARMYADSDSFLDPNSDPDLDLDSDPRAWCLLCNSRASLCYCTTSARSVAGRIWSRLYAVVHIHARSSLSQHKLFIAVKARLQHMNQGRSRRSGRSGHGLTTFSATKCFYYSLPPFIVIAQPPTPPYDSTLPLHGRTTFQKPTTTL